MGVIICCSIIVLDLLQNKIWLDDVPAYEISSVIRVEIMACLVYLLTILNILFFPI